MSTLPPNTSLVLDEFTKAFAVYYLHIEDTLVDRDRSIRLSDLEIELKRKRHEELADGLMLRIRRFGNELYS